MLCFYIFWLFLIVLLSLFIYLFVLFYLFYEVLGIFSETFHFKKCWRHRSLIKIFNFHYVNNSFSGFLDAPQMLNNNFSYLIMMMMIQFKFIQEFELISLPFIYLFDTDKDTCFPSDNLL